MQDKKLKISIGIVTNRKEMLCDLLDSIKNQTVKPHEVIIVENNKKKTLQSELDKYRKELNIVYLFEARGIAQGRNKVLKNAKGDVISFVDDDCVLSHYWINNISDIMSDNRVVGILGKFGNYYKNNFFANLEQLLYEAWLSQYIKINTKTILTSGIFINTRNFSLKKKIIKKCNLKFNPKAPFKIEDSDFGIRLFKTLKRQGSVLYAPDVYLLHKNSGNISDFFNRRKVSKKGVAWLKQKYPGYIENTPKVDGAAFAKLQKKSFAVWLLFFIERQIIRINALLTDRKVMRCVPVE